MAPEPEVPKSCPRRAVNAVLGFLDQTWLQTLQYIIFLFAFQSLTGTIPKSEEFYFDKYLTDAPCTLSRMSSTSPTHELKRVPSKHLQQPQSKQSGAAAPVPVPVPGSNKVGSNGGSAESGSGGGESESTSATATMPRSFGGFSYVAADMQHLIE